MPSHRERWLITTCHMPEDSKRDTSPVAVVSPTDTTPKVLSDRYIRSARLGKGLMGEVFAGVESIVSSGANLRRDVAIKVMNPKEANRIKPSKRNFMKEVYTQANLNVEGMPKVYSWGSDEGELYYVMEHINGESLTQMLEKGALSVSQTLEIAGQLAVILDRVHAKDKIHGDVSTNNAMVTPEGRVYLIDMGISPSVYPRKPGQMAGTLGYIAPEMIMGDPVTHRCDHFSFGATVYKLLTQQLVCSVDGKADSQILVSTCTGFRRNLVNEQPFLQAFEKELPHITSRTSSCSPLALARAADTVFARQLSSDPHNRYPTAQAFVSALADAFGFPVPQAIQEKQLRDDVKHLREHNIPRRLPATTGETPRHRRITSKTLDLELIAREAGLIQ